MVTKTSPKPIPALAVALVLALLFSVPPSRACAAYAGPVGEVADRIVAKVNGEAITLSELDEAVVERRLADPDARNLARRDLYEQELSHLIDDQLIYQAAKQNKIDAPPEMVAARVKEITTSLQHAAGSQQELERMLGQQNLTLDRLQQLIGQRESKQIVIDRAIAARFTITEADVKAFEQQLRAQGQVPTGYQLRQILILCPKDAAADTVSATRERAFAAALAAQTQMPFEDAVKKFSEDTATREQGGELGFVNEGAMMPQLEAAVHALQPGQISQPVRSDTGWHVFQLEGLRSPRKLLFAKRFEDARTEMLGELRRSQTIETQMEFLNEIPATAPTGK